MRIKWERAINASSICVNSCDVLGCVILCRSFCLTVQSRTARPTGTPGIPPTPWHIATLSSPECGVLWSSYTGSVSGEQQYFCEQVCVPLFPEAVQRWSLSLFFFPWHTFGLTLWTHLDTQGKRKQTDFSSPFPFFSFC